MLSSHVGLVLTSNKLLTRIDSYFPFFLDRNLVAESNCMSDPPTVIDLISLTWMESRAVGNCWEELVIPRLVEINIFNEERCSGRAAVLQTYAKTYELKTDLIEKKIAESFIPQLICDLDFIFENQFFIDQFG